MTSNPPNDLVSEVHDGQDGYIPANHWAMPYSSNYTFLNRGNLKLLEHANCSYLSTPGRPPTLLALKQHAQSLAVLISQINPSREAGEIDNENVEGATRKFTKDEAFDWLNNLQVHYDSLDKDHHRPLNTLANLIRQNSDVGGVQYHCPLDSLPLDYAEKNPEQQFRPFENHLTLLMHANECLERLDHEYSALGGLLSIIPTDTPEANELESLKSAKQTLVGQWILFTQHLVSRMHELEIAYANSLDLLANEALVPAQHNSVHGPDGRSGREIVFPQDRWILANAGEDVFNFIHQMLDKKEAAVERIDRVHDARGVVGDALYSKDMTRGIVSLDLSTRFYRIKGTGHGPLFVLPAFGDRPGTEYTRDMESRPTVVTVPTPGFPERTSAWEDKNRDKDSVNRVQFTEIVKLRREVTDLQDELGRKNVIEKRQQEAIKVYEDAQVEGNTMTVQIQRIAATRDKAEKKATELTKQVMDLEKELAVTKKGMAELYDKLESQSTTAHASNTTQA
ncbi:hypothetical protein DL766_003901 [Monosporascus sp. MC13-8B]|uniref:Uncharacterized protein n=1 Tax=Monosporascus cannonballus TaxID=155416 RepID=A0ABY0HGH6_9PEZI|nr:hypothetical protein DL762_001406 [Monosporascus cannonballus]RYP00981.1 hypothetical protein DL763_000402 [Monosporascus cannonballus]RYP32576.1 hypothetical protein DL766_003901 [Monosporascus sp. MC13-8B]